MFFKMANGFCDLPDILASISLNITTKQTCTPRESLSENLVSTYIQHSDFLYFSFLRSFTNLTTTSFIQLLLSSTFFFLLRPLCLDKIISLNSRLFLLFRSSIDFYTKSFLIFYYTRIYLTFNAKRFQFITMLSGEIIVSNTFYTVYLRFFLLTRKPYDLLLILICRITAMLIGTTQIDSSLTFSSFSVDILNVHIF